jgi:hypothetical protein
VRARRVDVADERHDQAGLHFVEAGVAVGLVGDRHRFGGGGLGVPLHRVVHGGRVVDRGHVLDRLDRSPRLLVRLAELELQVDRRLDPALRFFEAFGNRLFGDLRCAFLVELPRGFGATGFDHHDRDVTVVEGTTGHDDLEGRRVALLERGVRDPLALVVREAHRTDRTVERNARHGERRRRAVDRRDVVRVLEVDAEDRGDDLNFVAEVGRERRAQRPVGESARQDRLLTRPTFAAEERAGDLARGVHAFFDVDGEREEIDSLTGLARRNGRQQRRTADLDDHRAVRELCELACLERHFETGGVNGTGDANGVVAHGDRFLSFV